MRPIAAHQVESVLKPLHDAKALPFEFYTDPEIYAEEERLLFRREWQLAGRVDQVEKPGDFFSVDFMDEPLVILRDNAGQIRCFSRVCRHRGHRLLEGAGHCQNKTMVCPYHSWVFGLDGQLLKAKGMETSTSFDLSQTRLPEMKVEIWLGFIFINLDPGASALAPRLAGLEEYLAPWKPAEMRKVLTVSYDCEYNWKLMVENAVEWYHLLGAHQESTETLLIDEVVNEDLDGAEYLLFHLPYPEGISDNSEVALMGFPTLEGLPEVEKTRSNFFHIFPTANLFVFPDQMGSLTTVPVDFEHHKLVWDIHLPPEYLELPDFDERLELIRGNIEQIQREDMSACRNAYLGMKSAYAQSTSFSHMEESVWHFQRWYVGRMAPHLKHGPLAPPVTG